MSLLRFLTCIRNIGTFLQWTGLSARSVCVSAALHIAKRNIKPNELSLVFQEGGLSIYFFICVCVLLPSKQNQRGGDVTGWKGGLRNECQFIEARPHRNLEWREWKSSYTKYQRLTMDKLQWCYFV